MLSPLPGHFLVSTGNAKLLRLLGGGAGNIIIWTVIIEGIKEESSTEKLPEKQRHSECKAGHSHPPVLWPHEEETTLGRDRVSFRVLKESSRLQPGLCAKQNPNPSTFPPIYMQTFHVCMCKSIHVVSVSVTVFRPGPQGTQSWWGLCT